VISRQMALFCSRQLQCLDCKYIKPLGSTGKEYRGLGDKLVDQWCGPITGLDVREL
jgi:hypothetical protein